MLNMPDDNVNRSSNPAATLIDAPSPLVTVPISIVPDTGTTPCRNTNGMSIVPIPPSANVIPPSLFLDGSNNISGVSSGAPTDTDTSIDADTVNIASAANIVNVKLCAPSAINGVARPCLTIFTPEPFDSNPK